MTKYSKFLFCDITSKLIQKRDISQHCPLLMEVIPFPLFCQKSEQYLFFVSLKNFYDVNTKKSKNHILWHHLQKNLKRELSHHLSLLIEVMSFPFSEAGQTIHDSKLLKLENKVFSKNVVPRGLTPKFVSSSITY